MAEQVLMLALSPTMEEGTILKWMKKEGDVIATGDRLCEVETDKASMDYESGQEGVLLKIVKGEGSGAKVGDVIAIIGEKGEDFADLIPSAAPAAPAAAAVAAADKAAAPAAPAAPGKAAAPAAQAPAAAAPAQAVQRAPGERVKASPLARKIAEQKGIDIAQVPGTGPGGRVVQADVENFKGATAPATGGAASWAPAAASAPGLNDEKIPLSKKRQVIAQRLSESLFTAPHFFLTLSIEMDALMEARERINSKRKEKLGLNSFIIKFVAEALRRHQALNSSWGGDHIQNHSSVDIAIAVAQPDGLITPIVRQSHAKGILQIDAELQDLIQRARGNALKPEDYSGATFTISNLGSFGIEEFTAIINPPGAAILALGATQKVPVVDDDDEIRIAKQMKVTLSCDHRVIDGAVGAAFLKDLKDMMEDPYRVLL